MPEGPVSNTTLIFDEYFALGGCGPVLAAELTRVRTKYAHWEHVSLRVNEEHIKPDVFDESAADKSSSSSDATR